MYGIRYAGRWSITPKLGVRGFRTQEAAETRRRACPEYVNGTCRHEVVEMRLHIEGCPMTQENPGEGAVCVCALSSKPRIYLEWASEQGALQVEVQDRHTGFCACCGSTIEETLLPSRIVATQWLIRAERRGELIAKLKADDMLGLDCSGTVELERLASEDISAIAELARFILRNEPCYCNYNDTECPICGGSLVERDHGVSGCPGPRCFVHSKIR